MRTSIVKVYNYNPLNIKEVVNIDTYNITYIPTQKWNIYLILVNGKYCGVKINIYHTLCLIGENHESPRKKVGQSISNFLQYKIEDYIPHPEQFPNKSVKDFVKRVFKEKILHLGDFKRRDELAELNLIKKHAQSTINS